MTEQTPIQDILDFDDHIPPGIWQRGSAYEVTEYQSKSMQPKSAGGMGYLDEMGQQLETLRSGEKSQLLNELKDAQLAWNGYTASYALTKYGRNSPQLAKFEAFGKILGKLTNVVSVVTLGKNWVEALRDGKVETRLIGETVGVFGGIWAGASAGAVAGTAFGPPWGTIVGFAVGAVIGAVAPGLVEKTLDQIIESSPLFAQYVSRIASDFMNRLPTVQVPRPDQWGRMFGGGGITDPEGRPRNPWDFPSP